MPNLISIVGPTASGKSDLAVSLAKWLNAPVISADSVQVYQGMVIGSGAIKVEERQGVPHHLLNVYEPCFEFNAADFARSVDDILTSHFENHPTAVMVGGSGFYFHAVWEGFDEIPPVPKEAREMFQKKLEQDGLEYLVNFLKEVDEETWLKIDRKNPARVIRALEVWRGTGKPISYWQGKKNRPPNPWTDLKIGLEWDRQSLYRRIEQRVDAMMAEGWVEETKQVGEKYGMDCKGLKALGYKELVAHLKGEMDLETTVALIKQNTRRYAKRQMTWFKRYDDIQWFPPNSEEEIRAYLKSNLA